MRFGWAVAVGVATLLCSCAGDGNGNSKENVEDTQEDTDTEVVYSTDLDDCDFDVTTLESKGADELLADLLRNYDLPRCRGEVVAALESTALAFDLSAMHDERSTALSPLYPEDLVVSTPAGVDPENQVGWMVVAASPHDVGVHLQAALDPNQVCMQSVWSVYYGRSFLSDALCFSSGACSELRTSAEIRIAILAMPFWRDEFVDFAVVPLPDGRIAMVARTWNEEIAVADVEGNEYRQGFGVDIWYEDPADPTATVWLTARWTELAMPSVGGEFLSTLLMNEVAARIDYTNVFLDGGFCINDRDYVYDRP